jgi:hypothetical protein
VLTRALAFLLSWRRMAAMVAIGCALTITGLFLNPPRALLRRIHKELRYVQ